MGEPSSSKPLSPLRIPDSPLSTSDVLSREELLRRRSERLRQVTKLYKAFYWALMEELRAKYKDYYWRYGKSPYYNGEEEEDEEEEEEEEEQQQQQERNRSGGGNGNEEDVEEMRCEVTGCKAKAMALTRYCHAHILSDSKQNLYKGCTYCIKSTQTGPILCCKPVLRSTVPLLCPTHMQVAEKHLIRALKRAGLNISSTKRLAPKFHVVVAEYVRQIQTKRRAARKATVAKDRIDEEMR